jgi:hypothetical protein
MEEKIISYKALVGKLERKRPLENPRRRWSDNVITLFYFLLRASKTSVALQWLEIEQILY